MPVIDEHATLGELVTGHPSAARPLERLGLDYCCHGQRSLAAAAGDAGHDLDRVKELLADAVSPHETAEWAGLAPGELADQIEATHHRYLWDELPRLDALVDKITEVHGGRHPELAQVRERYTALRAGLEPHLRREEQLVFPAIRRREAGDVTPSAGRSAGAGHAVGDLIAELLPEHDCTGALLEELRDLTDGYRVPGDGCVTYRVCYEGLEALEIDTHLHVHKENNVLFPAVVGRGEAEASS